MHEKQPDAQEARMHGQTSVRVEPRAPRDPAAWTRPCLLGTACTCPSSDCAGRCPPLRNPYKNTFADCADRCSPLRTPCTGLFSDCARIAPPSPLVLASLPRCSLPRLRLAPPAYTPPAPVLTAPPSPLASRPASTSAGSFPLPLLPLPESLRPPRTSPPTASAATIVPPTAGPASARAPFPVDREVAVAATSTAPSLSDSTSLRSMISLGPAVPPLDGLLLHLGESEDSGKE